MRQGSAFRLCIFLASQPRGTVLFSDEVCERFKIPRKALSTRTAAAKRHGWLTAFRVKGENGLAYSAGPELLRLLTGS